MDKIKDAVLFNKTQFVMHMKNTEGMKKAAGRKLFDKTVKDPSSHTEMEDGILVLAVRSATRYSHKDSTKITAGEGNVGTPAGRLALKVDLAAGLPSGNDARLKGAGLRIVNKALAIGNVNGDKSDEEDESESTGDAEDSDSGDAEDSDSEVKPAKSKRKASGGSPFWARWLIRQDFFTRTASNV